MSGSIGSPLHTIRGATRANGEMALRFRGRSVGFPIKNWLKISNHRLTTETP
jgi:hypothetical protein